MVKRLELKIDCKLFNTTIRSCNMRCPFCTTSTYYNKITTIVNIHDEECDIYIGRGTKWGNKYVIGVDGTHQEVVEKYKQEALNNNKFIHDIRKELKGMVLG